jgi:tetratricopeptide (TPR) repeat protein
MMVHRLPSINTLENYAQLLMRENKVEQASQVMAQVVNIDDNNPYRWIDLANTYLKNGKSKLALKYANKANEMAPYLHEAYFIKSKAFAAMKKPGASVDAMRVAVDLSNTQTERVEYLNKLSALKQAYFAIEASTSSSVEN